MITDSIKRPTWLLLTLFAALVAPSVVQSDVTDAIARGDLAWADRSRGHQGARAAAEPIEEAIAAYQEALDADRENLEARWKLLRALYFKGEHVLEDEDARLELFSHGREIADTGRAQIERQFGLSGDSLEMEPQEVFEAIGRNTLAAEVYFWSSTHWGLWGRYRGKIAAARQGVATKIRKFAEIVILLDERIENAGGHRVLGRLHAEAPKIPLVTGWISRDKAITELRRALELAPDDLLTNLFLAEALLDFRPAKREEAIDLLQAIASSEPSVEWRVEDSQTIADAKARLAEEQR